VTGTPPLDWRVTEVEKNLGQLVDLVGTLTTGVQALQTKVDGKPAKTEPGPSRWAWQHATADQAAWLWAGLGPWVRWLNKPQQHDACLMTLAGYSEPVLACAFSYSLGFQSGFSTR